jgi:hypothetical protein
VGLLPVTEGGHGSDPVRRSPVRRLCGLVNPRDLDTGPRTRASCSCLR